MYIYNTFIYIIRVYIYRYIYIKYIVAEYWPFLGQFSPSDDLQTVHFKMGGRTCRISAGGFILEVSNPWGIPNSWMVYKGQSENKIDDLGVLQETSIDVYSCSCLLHFAFKLE